MQSCNHAFIQSCFYAFMQLYGRAFELIYLVKKTFGRIPFQTTEIKS